MTVEAIVEEALSFLSEDHRSMVMRLTLRQRQCLILVGVIEITEEDIAVMLGVSKQTVAVYFSTAKTKMKKMFVRQLTKRTTNSAYIYRA